MPDRSSRSRWKTVLFALIPAVVLLLLAEVGSRLAYFDESRGTWDVGVEVYCAFTKPGADVVPDPYNGYRFPEIADPASRRPPHLPGPPKAPGEVRVLCVGDSTTYGSGLDEGDAYPARLQRRLNAWAPEGVRFEVYNGGTPGFGPQQCKRELQSRYLALNPDIVLWREAPVFADSLGLPAVMSVRQIRFTQMLMRSRLVYLLHVLRITLMHDDRAERDFVASQLYNVTASAGEGMLEDILPEFIGWCEDRGVALFLGVEYLFNLDAVDLSGAGRQEEGASEDSIAGTGDLWRLSGIEFVPSLTAFREHPAGTGGLFRDFCHFRAKGAELQAQLVSEHLQDRWPELARGIFSGEGNQ